MKIFNYLIFKRLKKGGVYVKLKSMLHCHLAKLLNGSTIQPYNHTTI